MKGKTPERLKSEEKAKRLNIKHIDKGKVIEGLSKMADQYDKEGDDKRRIAMKKAISGL